MAGSEGCWGLLIITAGPVLKSSTLLNKREYFALFPSNYTDCSRCFVCKIIFMGLSPQNTIMTKAREGDK
jgi:hypothetical protein